MLRGRAAAIAAAAYTSRPLRSMALAQAAWQGGRVQPTPRPSEADDAGSATAFVEVLPEDGLRQGPVSVPAWVVWSAASGIVLLAVAALAYRMLRSRR